jgi:hypothetical protein
MSLYLEQINSYKRCGPIQPCLFGKKLYFLLFIDNYNRTWVYFFKEKSNVFNYIKKFKTIVEKK